MSQSAAVHSVHFTARLLSFASIVIHAWASSAHAGLPRPHPRPVADLETRELAVLERRELSDLETSELADLETREPMLIVEFLALNRLETVLHRSCAARFYTTFYELSSHSVSSSWN
jgi:hypothetical protein